MTIDGNPQYLTEPTEFLPVTACHWCQANELSEIAVRADQIPVVRCSECGLAFTGALPEDLGVFYDDDYFSRHVPPGHPAAQTGYEDYDVSYSPSSFRWLSRLLVAITTPDQRRLFDLGAATGTFLEAARYDGFSAAGSEINAHAAAVAESKGLNVRPGPFDAAGWQAGSFDIVTAFEVLEHVTDIRGTVEGLKSLLAPGGVLCFLVPNMPDRILERYGNDAIDFNKSLEHTIYFDAGTLTMVMDDVFGEGTLTLLEEDVAEGDQTVSYALGVVRLDPAADRPERDVFAAISGDRGVDGLSADAALAAALGSAKFFDFLGAAAALARAADEGADPADLRTTRAQVALNEGRMFDAFDDLYEHAGQGDGSGDPLAGRLMIEVIRSLMPLIGSDGDPSLRHVVDRLAASEANERQLLSAADERDAAIAQVENLTVTVERLAAEAGHTEAELATLKAELATSEAELATSEAELATSEAESARLAAELASSEAELVELMTESATLQAENNVFRDQSGVLQTAIEELQRALGSLDEYRSVLEAQRESATVELEVLKADLDSARRSMAAQTELRDTYETTASLLDSERNRSEEFRISSDRYREQLNEIFDSRAWRLIGAMRRVKKALSPSRRPNAVEAPEPEVPQSPEHDAPPSVTHSSPAVDIGSYPVSVSVIMPVYNKGRSIHDAIASVKSQTFTSVEIVVWDDGSTDAETLEALAEVESMGGVHVFRAPNQGVIGARNSAMSFARGEFFCCLDPDDRLMPTYLEKAVAVLRSDSGIAITYPWQRSYGDRDEIWRTQDLDPSIIASVNHVPVCSVFRRDVFVQTGGFSPEMAHGYEDWEFWTHAAELGFGGKVIPEPLFEYYLSDSAEESRDATARQQHLELATRIGQLHPLLHGDHTIPRVIARQAAMDTSRRPVPALPEGDGRAVVILVPWFTVGGADTVVEALVSNLVGRGRTVVVFTTLQTGEGMENRFADMLSLTPYAYDLNNILPREDWLDYVSRTIGALGDPVVFNVGSPWFYENVAEIRARHPRIRIVDQQFNDMGHFEGNRAASPFLDLTIAAYGNLAERIAADGRDSEVALVYVGIEQPTPSLEPVLAEVDATHKIVLFVGRFSVEKRPDWLPAIAEGLGDGAVLVAIGDGPLMPDVGPQLEATDNVVVIPSVAEVDPYMRRADVVILPSEIEGIPLVLMESLACGTAVVATAVGGIPEMAGIEGLTVVDTDDVGQFAAAVVEALGSDVKASLPDKFSIDHMVDHYIDLLDDADGRPRIAPATSSADG